MKPMVPLLAILLVFLSLTTTTAAGSHSHKVSCSQHNLDHQAQHKQTQDCHCPMHRASCCCAPLLFVQVHEAILPSVEVTLRFFELHSAAWPGPNLEAPFQPPRA